MISQKLCSASFLEYLALTQVRALQLPVHISYFFQKCKKSKARKWDLPFWYPKTQWFWNYVELWSIAVTTGFELMISKRNLESFEFYFFIVEGS